MHRAPGLLVVLLLPLISAGPASTELSTDLKTAHYDIHVEGMTEPVAPLLEAYFPELAKFFGVELHERLRVEIYATKDAFEEALRRDHQGHVEAGGYYSPGTRKAYLFVQPSQYFTRQLLLHECAHQYHFLAMTRNRPPRLLLYTEGLAEQLGMHNWDGKQLRIGVIPAITLENYPKKALEHFEQKLKCDLPAMLRGEAKVDRPESWAVIHFLLEKHPAAYRDWSHRLDLGEEPAPAAKAVFGDSLQALSDEFHRWLPEHQQPWKIEAISWQERGDSIEGSSRKNTVAVALPRQPAEKLTAELWPEEKNYLAGLTINYKSRGDYELLQVMGNRHVRLLRLADRKWIPEGDWQMPPKMTEKGCDVLTAVRADKTIELLANGKRLATASNDGAMGLHVQLGRVRFVMKRDEQVREKR